MLIAGVAGAYVPAILTRDLKRYQQPDWYIGLAVGYFLAIILVVWLAFRYTGELSYRSRWRWLSLALLVLLPNLYNIWIRATGAAPNGAPGSLFGRDGDVQLFYSYGHQFASGLSPRNFQGQYMEYPQFALFVFTLGAILSGKIETFFWLFPLLMVLFELGAAAALFGIGLKSRQPRAAYLLAIVASTCPFLYGFAYTRFDIVPTAFLLAAIYFFLPPANPPHATTKLGRMLINTELAGGGLTLGALTKWLPALASPWLAIAYLGRRQWLRFWIFSEVTLGLSLLTLLPFYFWNKAAFWYPYQYQSSRHLIGESFWFLVQNWFLDPTHAIPDKPWAEPAQILLSDSTLVVAQLALTLLVLGLSAWKLRRSPDATYWSGWAGAGLVGVAVFTLANRVFSPQYLILLVWVWTACLLLRPVGWKSLLGAVAALLTASAANFLTFLLGAYPVGWVNASTVMFAVAWIFSGWLLYRLLTPSSVPAP